MVLCDIIVFIFALFGACAETPAERFSDAVSEGNVAIVKSMLESGTDPNLPYENGVTAIFFAEKLEIVELLLSYGAKLEIRNRASIQSPIEYFARQYFEDEENRESWRKLVETLRMAGAEYTIDTAIYLNDIKFVQELLAKDASWVSDRKKAQSVPLVVAAETGRLEICKLLLEHKADPDSFQSGCGFPIMLYAMKHPEIVKLLIEHGANLRRQITWIGGRSGYWIVGDEASLLHYAIDRGNLESVKLLIEAGVDPNGTDIDGQTPMHIAIKCDEWERSHCEDRSTLSFVEIMKYLLENDASLRFRDKNGKTPLELAEELESPTCILQLLREWRKND